MQRRCIERYGTQSLVWLFIPIGARLNVYE